MNKMEGTKMVVRKLNPSGEMGCCGCIKIKPKKVVDSSPSEERSEERRVGKECC